MRKWKCFVTVCHCCTVAGGVNGWGHAEVHHHAFRHWLRHLGSRRGLLKGSFPNFGLKTDDVNAVTSFFLQQQNAMGVFAQSRFRCVSGRDGAVPGKKPGSGNRFREPKVVPFDGFRQVPGFPKVVSNRFPVRKVAAVSEVLDLMVFWWVLTVSKVGTKLLPPWGWAQCVWQCCAESECICVKRDC